MSNFNFGNTQGTSSSSGFTFGASRPIAPTMSVPNFNNSTSQAPTAASAAATTTAAFSFNAGSAAMPAITSTANFNFGTGTMPTVPTSNPVGSSTFGALGGNNMPFNQMNPSTTSASLNFGTVTTTTLGSGGIGLFGKPFATSTAAAPTTTTPFVGLGGIGMSANQPNTSNFKLDNTKLRETQVPDEIVRTVNALKTHIKSQKAISSEISRTSCSKLNNVSNDIAQLQLSLNEISNVIESKYTDIKSLCKETSKLIQTVEMAQHIQNTPVGAQCEDNGPLKYFEELTSQYEETLNNIREQIALIEHHFYAAANSENISLDEIKLGLRQINDCFTSLTGRLHDLHQKVEFQKQQYLTFRKSRLNDDTNIFASLEANNRKDDYTRISAGPTPFGNINSISNFSKSFNNTTTPTVASEFNNKTMHSSKN